jgi:hypothetical protein
MGFSPLGSVNIFRTKGRLRAGSITHFLREPACPWPGLRCYTPSMWELRLGDEIDDYCVKCRRLTNHLIVSLVDGKAAKVRCRTCYSDHDYRNEQAPPTKKELKQKELFNAVLSAAAPEQTTIPEADPEPAASKHKKKKGS